MTDRSAMAKRGVFITFEGGDGAGKTTQISKLAQVLRAAGRDVVETREPGGSSGGEAVRALLVKGDADRWSPLSEALMMVAARVDHVERAVRPALARGADVLCDRFADSTDVYQGIAGEVGLEKTRALHRLALGDFQPDLTFVLDPRGRGLARAGARGGEERRFEDKGAAFQAAVADGFRLIAENNADRCALIDASQDIDGVAREIHTVLALRLGARLGLSRP